MKVSKRNVRKARLAKRAQRQKPFGQMALPPEKREPVTQSLFDLYRPLL